MIRSKMLLFACLILITSFFPVNSYAKIQDWQKGLTLRLNNQSTLEVEYFIQQLKNTNADYVTITPGYITDNENSSNVDLKAGTPSDRILIYAINKAHSNGLKVFLKPHLDLKNNLWRANLDPVDKQTFFQNYKNMILHNAQIASDTKVEMLSIGAELVLLSTNKSNTDYWNDIISSIRGVYSGPLTYSANAGIGVVDETKLTFWDKLDYLGLSMYMSLSSSNKPTEYELTTSWKNIDTDYVKPFKSKYPSKPLIFTEMGFRSVDGASTKPWDYTYIGPVDLDEQNLLYKSFFNYWKNIDYFKGVHIWDWKVKQNAGGSSDIDYTPQNKPALDTIKNAFQQENTLPTPTPLANITPTIYSSPIPSDKVSSLTISNIIPNTYKLDVLKTNSYYYVDRNYVIKEIPKGFDNSLIIKTKNSDKFITNTSLFSYLLSSNADVFIAYDSRIKSLPNWLLTFTPTPFTIKTSDTIFNLYKKSYLTGNVVLGGNVNGNSSSFNISNYFVVIPTSVVDIPTPIPSISPSPLTVTINPIPSLADSQLYLNKQINVVEPTDNSIISGEKKVKISVEGLTLNQYSAGVLVNGNEYDLTNSTDNLYKQLKINYDSINNNTIVLEFYVKDISGNIFSQKSIKVSKTF